MFKKAAILVTLIVLSVPLFVGERFIEFDYEYVEYEVEHQVIARHVNNSESEIYGCSGYPVAEEKSERCDTEDVNVSYISDFDAPGIVDPEPVMEYPDDKLYGSGKTAYPTIPNSCPLPCGGDAMSLNNGATDKIAHPVLPEICPTPACGDAV